MKSSYIVASCKPWHRLGFDDLSRQENGRWIWASSPDELLDSVKNASGLRYIFFLHWSWRVPVEIWSAYECVCFHMTDVPYGRGGSPLQNLIVKGHQVTKLTALQMVEEMDAGPVYAKRDLSLEGRAEEIYLRAGVLSFDIVRWIVHNEPSPEKQKGKPTVFKRRTPAQSILPERGGLRLLYDHIRMLDAPTYPLAFLNHGDFRLEFCNASMNGDEIHASVVFKRYGEKGGE